MPLAFTTSYLKDSLDLFRYYKKLAERAMAQVSDEQLFPSWMRAGILSPLLSSTWPGICAPVGSIS